MLKDIILIISLASIIGRESILTGYPDILRCGGATEWGHLLHLVTSSPTEVVYQKINASNNYRVIFDSSTGAFISRTGGEITAGCEAQSILQVITERRSYNTFSSIVQDNTGASSLAAGWPDMLICGSGSTAEYFYYSGITYYFDPRYVNSVLIFSLSKATSTVYDAALMAILCANKSIGDLYAAGRGVNFRKSSTQSLNLGINPEYPDIIRCNPTDQHAFHLTRFGETYNEYTLITKLYNVYIRYTLTGDYLSYYSDVGTGILVSCINFSITQLYAAGRAFHIFECASGNSRDSSNFNACTCNQITFPDCLQCAADGCTFCQAGTYLTSTQTCVTVCPDPYYIVTTPKNICERCDFKCKSCTTASTGCVCADIRTNSPTCSCPNSYYSDGVEPNCVVCQNKCSKCASGSGCTECGSTLTRNANPPNCQCKDGFFENLPNPTTDCIACDNSCFQCSGPSSSDCTECRSSGTQYKLGQTCLTNCPIGTYPSDSPAPAQCQACDVDCQTCDGPGPTQCKSCANSRFMNSAGGCDSECPQIGYFVNLITSECKICPSNCDICQSVDSCQLCNSSTFLVNGICQALCPLTLYYPDQNNRICQPCHQSCLSCFDSLYISCSSCYDGFYLTSTQRCKATCDREYFANSVTQTCTACSQNCISCSSITVCSTCSPGFYQFTNTDIPPQTTCLLTCERGSIQDDFLQKCTACKTISPDKIYLDGKCTKGPCPLYQFLDPVYNDCVPCNWRCGSCTGPLSTQCTDCKNGYYIQTSGGVDECFSDCSEGFYPDRALYQCIACGVHCQKCNALNCEQCFVDFYRDNSGNCVASCTSEFFENQLTGTCDFCHPTCLTCFQGGLSGCLTCGSGLFLLGSKCYSQCPNRFYSSTFSQKCEKCNPSCFSCDGPNIDNCLQCTSGSFFDSGQCGTVCLSSRFYKNFEKGKCQACHQDCQTCQGPSSNQCLSCRVGAKPLLLNGFRCIDSCPSGYFSTGTQCLECHQSCLTCDGLEDNQCLSCKKNLYLVESTKTCETSCPINFVENFHNNQCIAISTCPEKQYLVTGTTCSSCHVDCLTCFDASQSSCLSCEAPNFLNPVTQSCVVSCPVDTYPYDIKRVCFSCSPQCQTCSDDKTCTSCQEGILRKIENNCECQSGYLTNEAVLGCSPCDSKCSKCQVIDTNCLLCSANRLGQTPICPCPQGYYNIDGVSECAKCHFQCLSCYSSGSFCLQCRGDRVGIDCQCPLGNYEDSQSITCPSCDFKCATCENNSSNCKTCLGDRILSLGCSCPDGKYQDGLQTICPNCSNQCLQCSDPGDICSVCRGDRIKLPDCVCPDGQYDDGFSESCKPCDITCSQCDIYGCLQCSENRFGPVVNLCVCNPEERGIDRLDLGTAICTTCTIGVTESQFSDDLSEIIIEIGGEILLVDETQNKSFALCDKTLNPDIINKIGGFNSICEVRDGVFVIKLGIDSTIDTTDYIDFKENSGTLQLSDCEKFDGTLILLTQFTNTIPKLVPPFQLKVPQVIMNSIPNQISLCRETIIEILGYKNTGQRLPKTISWKLISSTPKTNEIDQKLQTLLDDATKLGDYQVLIPPLFLQSFTVYEIQISFMNFVGVKGVNQIILKTTSTESIEIDIDRTIGASYSRREQIKFIASVDHLNCASGQVEIVEDQMDINWLYVSGTTPLVDKTIDKKAIKDVNEFSAIWNIPSYTFPSDSEQQLKIVVSSIANPQIQTHTTWKIRILASKILTIIQGGNRNSGSSSDIKFQGQSTDLDFSPQEQSQYQVDLHWTCKTVKSNEPCQNMSGMLIPESHNETYIITKQQLEPYNAYIIEFEGTQNNVFPVQKSSTQITLIIIQLDIPVLQVQVPEFISLRKINLNEKLLFKLTYPNANPDELFYSGVLIYDLDIVSLMIFQFVEFNIAIWDNFMDFQTSSSLINFRCSVYNPRFIMPSQTSVTLEVNIPPRLCQLEIVNLADSRQQDNHVSLEEQIRLQVTNCLDENQPFTYRFGYYTNTTMMNYDILQGLLGLNLNYLTEYQKYEFVDSIMIPSQVKNVNNADVLEPIVILAQIMDSLGGITNITQSVQVSAPSLSYVQNQEQIQQSIIQLQEKKGSEVSQLTIYSISLSPFDSPDFLFLDNLLVSRLNYHLQFNPVSIWKEQIMKALGILNNQIDIIDSRGKNVTEFDSMFTNLDKFLDTLEVYNLTTTGTNDENTNKLLKSLDSMNSLLISSNFKPGDAKSSNITTNDSFTRQISNEKNKNLVNSVLQTVQLLKQDALPNQPPKEFYSGGLNLKSQVLTTKKLQELLNPGETFQLLDKDDGEYEISKNSDFAIHNFGLQTFQTNPYSAEENFPYPESMNKVYLLNVQTISRINSIVQKSRFLSQNSSSISINQSSSSSQTNYIFKIPVNATQLNNNTLNDSNTCIQKDIKSSNWTDESCTQSVVKNSLGEVTGYSCKCGFGNPITLVNDIKDVLQNNKLKKAFSSDGLDALSSWNFWEEPLFYAFSFITVMYLISLPFGIIKDKNDSRIHPKEISKQDEKVGDQINPSHRNLITDEQNIPDGLNKKNDIIFNKQEQIKVEDFMELEKRDENQNLGKDSNNSVLDEDLEGEEWEKKQKNSPEIFTEKRGKNFSGDLGKQLQISSNGNQKKLENYDSKQEEIFSAKNIDFIEKQNLGRTKTLVQGVTQKKPNKMSFNAYWEICQHEHTLISIMYQYDVKESRARRYSLQYIKTIVYLSILMGFSKSTIGQTIAVCLISSIVVKICISIVGSLLSSKSYIIQFLGVLLTFGICGLGFWIILVLLAVSDQTDIEEGFYKFVSQILNDYIFIDNLKCLLSLIAILSKSNQNDQQSLLVRISYIFYQKKAHKSLLMKEILQLI